MHAFCKGLRAMLRGGAWVGHSGEIRFGSFGILYSGSNTGRVESQLAHYQRTPGF